MSKEPSSNIGSMCTNCADERLNQWQKNNIHTVIVPGAMVKIGFEFQEAGKISLEHMWVQVDSIADDVIVGRLYNDPVKVKNVEFMSRVTCKRSQISDYMPPDKLKFT